MISDETKRALGIVISRGCCAFSSSLLRLAWRECVSREISEGIKEGGFFDPSRPARCAPRSGGFGLNGSIRRAQT